MTPPNSARDAMNGKQPPANASASKVDREAGKRQWEAERLAESEAEALAEQHLTDLRFTHKYVAPLFSIADALQPQPAIDWAIHELAETGGVIGVFSAPGMGKTYCITDLCMCMALGEPWLGRATKQCKVLWIDEDSGRKRLLRRLGDVARGHQAPADTPFEVLSLAGVNILQQAGADELQRLITERGAGVVVLDTLADVCVGAKIISPDEMLPALQALRRIAEATGALIIFLHHTNKGGEFLGATTIAGKADLLLQLENPGNHGLVTFTSQKVRDTGALKFAAQMNFSPESNEFWLSLADMAGMDRAKKIATMGGAAKHVYEFLKDNDQATVKQMIDELHGRDSVRQAVLRLTTDKILYRVDIGTKGKEGVYAIAKNA